MVKPPPAVIVTAPSLAMTLFRVRSLVSFTVIVPLPITEAFKVLALVAILIFLRAETLILLEFNTVPLEVLMLPPIKLAPS